MIPERAPEIALVVSLGLAGIGQVLFKRWALARAAAQPAGRLAPISRLVPALVAFAVAQLGFFVALTKLSVGVVYMSTAATQVLVLYLSYWWLGEAVTKHHITGVAAIVLGILLYAA